MEVMPTLEGTAGSVLQTGTSKVFEPAEIRPEVLELPPVVIEDFASPADYHRALRPAFDALWNAGGELRCGYFTENGELQ
jgi:hypothetical protein